MQTKNMLIMWFPNIIKIYIVKKKKKKKVLNVCTLIVFANKACLLSLTPCETLLQVVLINAPGECSTNCCLTNSSAKRGRKSQTGRET